MHPPREGILTELTKHVIHQLGLSNSGALQLFPNYEVKEYSVPLN